MQLDKYSIHILSELKTRNPVKTRKYLNHESPKRKGNLGEISKTGELPFPLQLVLR